MDQHQDELHDVDEILGSGDASAAAALVTAGKWFTILFNTATTFLFGYYFVRLLGVSAKIGNVSADGIAGGIACAGLLDGMARIWDAARRSAAETSGQHQIAKMAYLFSVAVSVLMTLIYLVLAINFGAGVVEAIGTGAFKLGTYVITVTAVIQLLFFLFYEQNSEAYIRSRVRSVSRANMNRALLNMEARMLEGARKSAGERIAANIPQLADDMATAVWRGVVRRLGTSENMVGAILDTENPPALPPAVASQQSPTHQTDRLRPAVAEHAAPEVAAEAAQFPETESADGVRTAENGTAYDITGIWQDNT